MPWLLPLGALLLGVAMTLVLAVQLLPSRYDLKEGDVSRDSIKSPSQFSFASQVLTKQERDRAELQVPDVFREDPSIATEQMSRAKEATNRIGSIIFSPGLSTEEKRGMLVGLPGLNISSDVAVTLVGMSPGAWPAVEAEIMRLVGASMQTRLSALEVAQVKGGLEARINPSLPVGYAPAITFLSGSFVRSNVILDQDATGQAKRAAREAIIPVRVAVEKGETIIRDGEIVTAAHREKLAAAGLLNPAVRWENLAGTGLPTVILVLIIALYLFLHEGGLRAQPRRLGILGLIIIITVLAAKLTIPGRDVYSFLFPLAAAPMLIASLISAPTAILSTVLLSVAVGFVGAADPQQLMTVHLMAGLVGALLIRKAERITTFFIAGAGVAGASFLGILAFRLLGQDYEVSRLGLYAFVSVVNGGLTSILTLGIVALLGLVFGLVTPIHLMELAHPNQKLLRLLAMEAPGTYHHSLLVANLAERAAESVGGDVLLLRVGAYYHDIGKVVRPGFFVENQMHGENIHDDLEPSTSARIVAAHVEEGIKLAERNRLPRQIRDLIAQHHGNKLVLYFYHRACLEGETDPEGYRYTGPRPNTKEAAILMLADTIEAAARSLKEHSTEAMESLVEKTISENVVDGQLDECDLTLRELDLIKDSFKAVIRGVYHPRIEYPAPSPSGK